VAQQLGVSKEVGILGLTLFVLGYGLGELHYFQNDSASTLADTK
jgi:hypothetical protein